MTSESIKKTYGRRVVLDVPALTLRPGRLCAVIGANGSGKSTLIRILAGAIRSDSGVRALPEALSVGYMPQKSYPFRMSVLKNVMLTEHDREKALALLDELGIRHLARERAARLSGGETARMALARLLMQKHDILLLDEPTASMDMESTMLTEKRLVRECRENDCAVLLVTHSLQQARRIADDAIFLCKGRIAEQGAAEQVLYTPNRAETRQFLDFFGN